MENNDYYAIPKDSFSETLLITMKESYLADCEQAKLEIVLQEKEAGTFDEYVLETCKDIDGRIKNIQDMSTEDFVGFLFYNLKGQWIRDDRFDFLNIYNALVEKPSYFVDRGY